MRRTSFISFLKLCPRAVLATAALAGTADGAIRRVFTPGAIQARVAEALNRLPDPIPFDARTAASNRLIQSSNRL